MAEQDRPEIAPTPNLILAGIGIGAIVGLLCTSGLMVSVCTYPDPDGAPHVNGDVPLWQHRRLAHLFTAIRWSIVAAVSDVTSESSGERYAGERSPQRRFLPADERQIAICPPRCPERADQNRTVLRGHSHALAILGA